jgi:hypothetical protein
MENNFMLTDEILWEYADGFLEPEVRLQVETYLRQHPDQKARLDAILNEKRAFAALPLEKPGAGFSSQLMAAWAAEQAPANSVSPVKQKSNDWILWGIGIAFLALILIPILGSSASAPVGNTLQIPEGLVPQVELPVFDWNGFFSSALLRNFTLLILGFMSLKILDKYLQLRSHKLIGQ